VARIATRLEELDATSASAEPIASRHSSE